MCTDWYTTQAPQTVSVGQPLKLLHIIGSVDESGGGTTDHVVSTAQIWAKEGWDCHVLCLDSPDAACVARSPLKTIALGPKGRAYRFFRRLIPLLRYGYTPRLKRWLDQNAADYDAIILNGLWNYTSVGSWRALRNSRTPYFLCPHGMLDPWLRSFNPVRHWFRVIFWKLIEKRVAQYATSIIFACEEERRLAQYFLAGLHHRSVVVPYGSREPAGDRERQREAFFQSFPYLKGKRFILFLSRIHPKKGVDLLVEAFGRVCGHVPEFELVIAGPDQTGLVPELTRMARDLGVDKKIHWVGMLRGDVKWGAFLSASFFALPSHQENFGIAIVEAMALGLPVLISNKVNIWQEVNRNIAGRIVDDNVDDVTRGLEWFCNLPEEERNRIGRNARDCFANNFDLQRNAIEFLNVIRSSKASAPVSEAVDDRSGAWACVGREADD